MINLPHFDSWGFCSLISDVSYTELDSTSFQTQKPKRMRTRFKCHQLKAMKAYFMINHNPDAKDIKQLSQETGLTKRVLQVHTHSYTYKAALWKEPPGSSTTAVVFVLL